MNYTRLYQLTSHFFHLLFPRLCAGCQSPLVLGEDTLCLNCLTDLPLTHFEDDPNNPVAQSFWGRFYLENAAALCYFEKGNRMQKLLHQLKYKNNPHVGRYLGEYYGHKLAMLAAYQHIDMIIPVPLHPKKRRLRGYNQSEEVAKGLNIGLRAEVLSDNLSRRFYTETQTHKSREERWDNVDGIFFLKHPEKLKGKHILLVDDVITTGATLEACCQAFAEIEGIKISIVALAYPK